VWLWWVPDGSVHPSNPARCHACALMVFLIGDVMAWMTMDGHAATAPSHRVTVQETQRRLPMALVAVDARDRLASMSHPCPALASRVSASGLVLALALALAQVLELELELELARRHPTPSRRCTAQARATVTRAGTVSHPVHVGTTWLRPCRPCGAGHPHPAADHVDLDLDLDLDLNRGWALIPGVVLGAATPTTATAIATVTVTVTATATAIAVDHPCAAWVASHPLQAPRHL